MDVYSGQDEVDAAWQEVLHVAKAPIIKAVMQWEKHGAACLNVVERRFVASGNMDFE
jgi:hypothetical protein